MVNTAGLPYFSNYTDNTYHVVTLVMDNDALLDGFTIASGQSMTGGWKSVSIKTANVFPFYGAGLHANMTNLVVLNCNFIYNNPGDSHTSIAGEHSHRVSGGDAESRPVNVSANYIIRCEWS